MKDINRPNIVAQSPARSIKTADHGRFDMRDKLLAYYSFDDYPEAGEFRFEDEMDNYPGLEVVKGISSGVVTPTPIELTGVGSISSDPYVSSVGVETTRTLPSGLTVQGRRQSKIFEFGRDEVFMRQVGSRNLLPISNSESRTFHINLLVLDSTKVRHNKSILSFAEPNSSQAFFSVGFSSATTIRAVFHDYSTGGYKYQDIPVTSGSGGGLGGIDIFVTPTRDASGNAAFDFGYVWQNTAQKRQPIAYVASQVAGTHAPRNGSDGTVYGNPALYMGYGELTGGVNDDFTSDDYLTGSHGFSLSVYNGKLKEREMKALLGGMVYAHPSPLYKSGIESRPVKQMNREADRVRAYPSNRVGATGRELDRSADPFNDMHAIDAVRQPLVYPEMIPLSMYSGSISRSRTIRGGGGAPTAEATLKWRPQSLVTLNDDGTLISERWYRMDLLGAWFALRDTNASGPETISVDAFSPKISGSYEGPDGTRLHNSWYSPGTPGNTGWTFFLFDESYTPDSTATATAGAGTAINPYRIGVADIDDIAFDATTGGMAYTPSGSIKLAHAITGAINQAVSSKFRAYIPAGTYVTSSAVTIKQMIKGATSNSPIIHNDQTGKFLIDARNEAGQRTFGSRTFMVDPTTGGATMFSSGIIGDEEELELKPWKTFTGGSQGEMRALLGKERAARGYPRWDGSQAVEYLPASENDDKSTSKADTIGFQISSRHHTPLSKRIILNAVPRRGNIHDDTYRFQRFAANEISVDSLEAGGWGGNLNKGYAKENNRSTAGKITPNIKNRQPRYRSPGAYASPAYNTGSIEPFNESRVSADARVINLPGSEAILGFDQRLGSHIAIEIPLNPVESTTFGIDRRNNFSMGYFNFSSSKWDAVGQIPGVSGSLSSPSGFGIGNTDALNFNGLIHSTSLGFVGTTGFAIYPEDGGNITSDLKHRGSPSDLFGFPVDNKYSANDNQLLDMSKYIDAPFLLERWEIQFEAEVEESGPESLGYIMPTRTEVGDFSRIKEIDGTGLRKSMFVDRWEHLHISSSAGLISREAWLTPTAGEAPPRNTSGSVDFVHSSPGVYWPGWRLPSRTNAQAAATFTAQPSVGEHLIIESADSTSKTYVAAASQDTSARNFLIGATVRETINNLKACIETNDPGDGTGGHGGKLWVSDPSATSKVDGSAGVLVVNQVTPGTAGNGKNFISTWTYSKIEGFSGGGGNTTAYRLVEDSSSGKAGHPLPGGNDRPATDVSPALESLVIPSSRYALREWERAEWLSGSEYAAGFGGLMGTHHLPGQQKKLLSGNVGYGAPPDVFRGITYDRLQQGYINVASGLTGAQAPLSNGFELQRGIFIGSSPTWNVAGVGDGTTNSGGPGVPTSNYRRWTPYFRPSLYITGTLYPAGEAGYYYLASGTMLPHGGSTTMLSGSGYASKQGSAAKYPILWAGRNGQPTGSTTGITPHRENVQVWAKNGVPFWRCDTFFLLRQHNIDKVGNEIPTNVSTQISGFTEQSTVCRSGQLISPQNGSSDVNGLLHKTVHGLTFNLVNSPTKWDDPITQKAADQSYQEGESAYRPQIIDESALTSTREMITYSQMATYGYTAATAVDGGSGVTQAIKVGNTSPLAVSKDKNNDQYYGGSGEKGINIDTGVGTSGDGSGTIIDSSGSLLNIEVNGTNVPYHGNTGPAVVPITTSSFAFGGGSVVNAPGVITDPGKHQHWRQYGNFRTRGRFFQGALGGKIPGLNSRARARCSSWLDAGLGRDLNVLVRPNQGTRKVWNSQCFEILGAPMANTALYQVWSGNDYDDHATRGEGTKNQERSAREGFVFSIKRAGSARPDGRFVEETTTYRIWFKNGAGAEQWSTVGPTAADKSDGDDIEADYNWGIDWSGVAQLSSESACRTLATKLRTAFNSIGKSAGTGPRPGFYVKEKVDATYDGDYAGFTKTGVKIQQSNESFPCEFEIIHQGKYNAFSVYIRPAEYEERSLNFTILTASIPSSDGAGAHSAAAMLGANVYQRNFLSTGSFSIHAPIRRASKSTRSAPVYLTTWKPVTVSGVGAGNFNNLKRRNAAFLQVPYTPGSKKSGISSARSFVKAVSADKTRQNPTWTKDFRGIHAVASGQRGTGMSILYPEEWADNSKHLNWDSSDLPTGYTQVSGSDGTKVSNEGLYVLMPDDKLILGFQPSQHGGNPGNPQPMNANIRPYAPFGVQSPPGTNNLLTGSDNPNWRDTAVFNIREMKGNLATQYEPAHSFTMKKGKAKLVLYGTLVKDNRHVQSQYKQNLNTSEVHTAIVGDTTITDQFLVEGLHSYSGSYLQTVISGSTTLIQTTGSGLRGGVYSRGEKLHAFDGTLGISGSLQRFVTLTDQSELNYDSLLPDFGQIFVNAGHRPVSVFPTGGSVHAGKELMYLNLAGEWTYPLVLADISASSVIPGSELNRDRRYERWSTLSSWTTAFPFERKWGHVERMTAVNDHLGFGVDAQIILLPGMKTMINSPGKRSNDMLTPARLSVSGTLMNDSTGSAFQGTNKRTLFLATSVKMAEGEGPSMYRSTVTGKFFKTPVAATQGPGSFLQEYYETSTGRPKLRYVTAGGFWTGRNCVTGSASVLGVIMAQGADSPSGQPIPGAGGQKFGDRMVHLGFSSEVTSSIQYVQLDHPSGWKYGLSNCLPRRTTAVFRPDRYGQFRDMLEQRHFTRFFDEGLSENIRGKTDAAVSCIFLDSDRRPVTNPQETSCGNLSTAMTSSRPFIEGSVEERVVPDSFISVT